MLHFWKIQNLRASPPCFSYSYYSENYIQLFVLKMYLPCFVLLIFTYITLNCCLFLKRLGLPSVMEDKNKCLLSFSVAAQCSISHMILTDVKVIRTEIFFTSLTSSLQSIQSEGFSFPFVGCFCVTSTPKKWVLHSH